MSWLEILKKEMLEITKPAAYEEFPAAGSDTEPYCNPRFAHVTQAEKEALKLLEVYSGDGDIVLASVWIHDRYKPLFIGEDHESKAADWALEYLEGKGFPKEKVKAVEYAVRNHAGWEKRGLDTLEAQILWDADKVSHYGISYTLKDILMFQSRAVCERFFKIDYEPTVTVENMTSFLTGLKREARCDEPHPYYLEETVKIYLQKVEAMNSFADALQRQL